MKTSSLFLFYLILKFYFASRYIMTNEKRKTKQTYEQDNKFLLCIRNDCTNMRVRERKEEEEGEFFFRFYLQIINHI
jgi:hypothetical protein